MLPANILRLANCYEAPASNYYDCVYQDTDGVQYLVYGHEIVRKDIRQVGRYTGRLIGGIGAGDTLRSALRKLQSLPDDIQAWSAHVARDNNNAKIFLSPSVCLHQPDGTLFWFDLTFDESDKLAEVTVMYEPQ